MRRRRGISTAVASIAALITVLAVASIMTAILLGRLSTVSAATSERLAGAHEKIPVRLSTVYHVPPVLVVSNDGVTPVRITKIYKGSEAPANILIRPGERAELNVGNAPRVAVEVEGWGVVVLQTVETPTGSPPEGGTPTDDLPELPFRRCQHVDTGLFDCTM